MKNYLLLILLTILLGACKSEGPARPAEAKKPTQVKSKTEISAATRDGNIITQKVTVAPNSDDTDINARTAIAMIANNKQVKVMDVRTPEEIQGGSYPNSIKIDINNPEFKTEINKLDKNATYIVYCKSGGRSQKAVSMMKAFGFKEAFNMVDGFDALDMASK